MLGNWDTNPSKIAPEMPSPCLEGGKNLLLEFVFIRLSNMLRIYLRKGSSTYGNPLLKARTLENLLHYKPHSCF